MKLRLLPLGLALIAVTALIGNSQNQKPDAKPSPSGYHQVKKMELGGEGGWDYLTVDSSARRLYVSHSTRVLVVNADSGAQIGEIPGTNGVHGIALVPELGRGFTSNGRDANVTIFDLTTLKAIRQTKTGNNPDAIIYDSASGRVFAFNGASADATAIDAKSGDVAGTIALGGKPEFAVADGDGKIYVNIEDKSLVAVLDSRKLTVTAKWPLSPCEEPSGMAMDRKNKRLFIGCANRMMAVMDAEHGRVLTTLPIGNGVDANAFDPDTNYIFSSNGDGTLTIVHEDSPDKFSLVENVVTQRGARTMALDPKTHNIFLATAQFGPMPLAAPGQPRPRPSIVPGTFCILVFGK